MEQLLEYGADPDVANAVCIICNSVKWALQFMPFEACCLHEGYILSYGSFAIV